MIECAALFSVVPMATQSGKGASAQGTSGGGGFAEVLQKSQTSSETGADAPAAAVDRGGSGDKPALSLAASSSNSGSARPPAHGTPGEADGKDATKEAGAEASELQRGKGDAKEAPLEESHIETGVTPEGDASGSVKKPVIRTGETTKVRVMVAGMPGSLVPAIEVREANFAGTGEASGEVSGEVDVESAAASGASGSADTEECGEGDIAIRGNDELVQSQQPLQGAGPGTVALAVTTDVSAQTAGTAASVSGAVPEGEGAGPSIETVAANASTATNELEKGLTSTVQDAVVKEKVQPEAESARQSAPAGDKKASAAGGKGIVQRALSEMSNNCNLEGAGNRKETLPEANSSLEGQVPQSRTAQQNVRVTADPFIPTPAPGASFQATRAADLKAMNRVATSEAPTASIPLREEVIAGVTEATPVVMEEVNQDSAGQPAKAASVTATGQQQSSASSATKGAPEDATALVEEGEAAATAASDGANRLPEGDEATAAPTAAAMDKSTEAAAPSSLHESEQQRLHSAQKEPAEQEAVKSDYVAGRSESENSSTGRRIKTSTVQANMEQENSGDGGTNLESRQKAQVEQTAQGPAPGMDARIQESSATERGVGQCSTNQSKSALHQSILSQVRDGVVIRDGKGKGEMSIRLHPNELGELKIQVRMEDSRLRIDVQAENRMVKDLLISNLDSLKEALSGKNFTVDGFDVSTGGSGFNSSLSEQKANPQQQTTPRLGKAAGYGESETRINYVTEKANSLLSVRL